MDRIWVNGRATSQVGVADRGLAYGDGLFETVRVQSGAATLWSYHLDRLQCGARVLGIPMDRPALEREAQAFLRQCRTPVNASAFNGSATGAMKEATEPFSGVLKIMLTRGEGGRGYLPPADAHPNRILMASARPQPAAHIAQQGARLILCQTQLSEQPKLAGLKHLNRLEQVLARQEVAQAGADEGLLADSRGRWIEGVQSNLFAVIQGELLTPPLTGCGVAGTLRRYLLQNAPKWGVAMRESWLSSADLKQAEELFLGNSVMGLMPVGKLAQWRYPIGSVTQTLQQRLADLFHD